MAKPQPKPPAPAAKPQVARFALPKSSALARAIDALKRGDSPVLANAPEGFDALALADAESPDLILDFSTLTGAARVALGPDLPAFFTEDDALADAVAEAGRTAADPVWRMPLHAPYASLLDSKVADLNNVSGGPFAGAITAALFLRRFAPKTKAHGHFDLYGWNPSTKPGRPEGGEVQTARLTYALLTARYGG